MDTETLALFEDGLARFSRERYPAARIAEPANADQDADRWREMAELGWFDLAVAESGPPEITPLLSIYRAAGEGLWREPIDCVFGASALVAAKAPDPLVRRMIWDGLSTGASPLCFASREPGSDWGARTSLTRTRTSPEGTLLRGRKIAAVHHPRCAAYLVSAIDDSSGKEAYYRVERGAPGLQVATYPTVEGRSLSDLDLEGTPATFVAWAGPEVPVTQWLGMLAAAECVGIMRGALQDTVTFLRQRRQFGKALIEFQALQHRLAEMLMLMRETDALLRDVAADLDAGREVDERDGMVLRAQSARAASLVTREAVQMHGGMGVTQECRVSHYYRRVLTLESLHGSESWALERLA